MKRRTQKNKSLAAKVAPHRDKTAAISNGLGSTDKSAFLNLRVLAKLQTNERTQCCHSFDLQILVQLSYKGLRLISQSLGIEAIAYAFYCVKRKMIYSLDIMVTQAWARWICAGCLPKLLW